MSFDDIVSKTKFNGFADKSDEELILRVMRVIYEKSSDMFEEWNANPTNTIEYEFSTGPIQVIDNNRIQIDIKKIESISYIDNTGSAVQATAEFVIAHELVHVLTPLEDNVTEVDYVGDTVREANKIYSKLGIPLQNSYSGVDERGNILIPGFQYTYGTPIDRSVVVYGLKSWMGGMNYDWDSSGAGDSNDLLIGGNQDNRLVAGEGNDFLYGNGGDDLLNGGKGNDFLFGGEGEDTYEYTEGDGLDIVFDADGEGSILIDDKPVNGGTKFGDERVHRDDDNHLYVQVNSTTLIIDGKIIVNNHVDGALNLSMNDEAPALSNPLTTIEVTGDIRPADIDPDREGVQAEGDYLNNPVGTAEPYQDSIGGSIASDHIDTGELLDLAWGGSGNDWIEGGGGNDHLMGGTDDDLIEGESGKDILLGEEGDDQLYYDVKIEASTAIADGNTDGNSGEKGDWLAGGSGSDILISGADNDVLSGGSDSDLLIAGAGDDLVLGDADVMAKYFMSQPLVMRYSVKTPGPWITWNTISPEVFNWNYEYVDNTLTFKSPVLLDSKPEGGAADVIYAGNGKDLVFAGEGNDVVFGEGGDDILSGDEGNDVLIGGTDEDTLLGGTEDDYLDGGSGNDGIYGHSGNDILVGGGGNDTLLGGEGQDTYIFNIGDGIDTIYDTKSDNNIIRFGEGINKNDIKIHLGSLMLDLGNGDAVHIGDFDQNDVFNSSSIRGFEFADGSTLTTEELLARGFDLDGTDLNDEIIGTNTVDRISAGTGNDILSGMDGDDSLTGGKGIDSMDGGGGDDTYVLSAGDSPLDRWGKIETIVDGNGNNTIVFTDVVSKNLVLTAQADGQSLKIDYSPDGHLLVTGGLTGSIAKYKFSDGSELSYSELIGQRMYGVASYINADGVSAISGGCNDNQITSLAGNTTISGGQGNDVITTAGGNNTFLYSLGDGSDRLVDTSAKFNAEGLPQPNVICFGQDISPADIDVFIEGSALILKIGNDGNDQIRIENFDPAGPPVIDRFEFSDGEVVIGFDELINSGISLVGSSGNDVINGMDGDDSLDGGKGDDLLSGGSGADTYLLKFGGGKDTVYDTSAELNTIQLTAGMTFGSVRSTWSGNDLMLTNPTSGDEIRLLDCKTGTQHWQLSTDDGITMSLEDFLARPVADGNAQVAQLWADNKNFVYGEAIKYWASLSAGITSIYGSDISTYSSYGSATFVRRTTTSTFIASGTGTITDLGVSTSTSGTTSWDQYGVRQWLTHVDSQRIDSDAEIITVTDPYFYKITSSNQLVTIGLDFNDYFWTNFSTNSYSTQLGGVPGEVNRYSENLNWQQHAYVIGGTALPANWTAPLNNLVDNQVATTVQVIEQTRSGLSEVFAGESNNQIYTANGIYDMVDGGAGDDFISGGDGDFLYGNDGNDSIVGGSGSETLIGGLGIDWLFGGNGADRYVVINENSIDHITDDGFTDCDILPASLEANAYALLEPYYGNMIDADTVVFGAGVSLENLRITGSEDFGSIFLEQADGTGVEVALAVSGDPLGTGIELFEFDDGSKQTIQQMTALMNAAHDISGMAGNDMLILGNGADIVRGLDGDDWLCGGGGNDIIDGGKNNDSLEGGTGSDVLIGGDGDDSYSFYLGDGHDRIDNTANDNASAIDVVALGDNILPTDVAVYAQGNDLVLGIGDSNSVTIANYFSLDSDQKIDQIAFCDAASTVWNQADIEARLGSGSNGADRLTGGAGIDVFHALGGDDAIYGNDGDDQLYGDSGNDSITGGAGNDLLDGGAGADKLYGGIGDDLYIVDSATDVVTENLNEGTDLVQSSETYTLTANLENLTLSGTSAINGTGNNLDNVLIGNGAANKLAGGTGNDTYVVGTGDTVTEASSAGTDTVIANVTWTLGSNLENLTLSGTAAINGTGNTLSNVLTGNSAANVLAGGTGNDTYVVGTGDTVTEASSAGTDTVIANVTWTLGSNLENLTLSGTAAINGTGNTLSNVLTGNSAANVLAGGTGADTMIGGAGNDTYVVDNTADTVTEGLNEGTDLVQSTVTHTLSSNVENLTLTGTTTVNGTGNALDNVLTGNSANNKLTGGDGNDTIDGGAGNDTMLGGLGDDTFVVNVSTDVVTEVANAGNDTIKSGVTLTLANNVENLFLTGTSAINGTGNTLNNLIRGNTAINTLNGGTGIDILEGGDGNDILTDTSGSALFNGGTGADTITGGASAEIFLGGLGNDTYTTAGGNDVILFNKGDGQDIFATGGSGSDIISLGGGIDYTDLVFSKVNNDLVLNIGTADQITFKNWYAATPSKPVTKLQVMAEAMTGFVQGGSDPLKDQKVENFDFSGLVGAFDAARTANTGLTSWALTNALTGFQLAGSDTAAMGGDLAYQYGKNGTLTGIGVSSALSTLSDANLGTNIQTLTPLAGLQTGSVRLS